MNIQTLFIKGRKIPKFTYASTLTSERFKSMKNDNGDDDDDDDDDDVDENDDAWWWW